MVREDELLKEGLKETCSIFNLAVSGGKADLFARVKDKIDPTKFLDKLNEHNVDQLKELCRVYDLKGYSKCKIKAALIAHVEAGFGAPAQAQAPAQAPAQALAQAQAVAQAQAAERAARAALEERECAARQEVERMREQVARQEREAQATAQVQSTASGGKLTGTAKKWVAEKGFGFIGPDGGGSDVFCHHSNIEESGCFIEGAKLAYVMQWNYRTNKWQAEKVTAHRGDGPGATHINDENGPEEHLGLDQQAYDATQFDDDENRNDERGPKGDPKDKAIGRLVGKRGLVYQCARSKKLYIKKGGNKFLLPMSANYTRFDNAKQAPSHFDPENPNPNMSQGFKHGLGPKIEHRQKFRACFLGVPSSARPRSQKARGDVDLLGVSDDLAKTQKHWYETLGAGISTKSSYCEMTRPEVLRKLHGYVNENAPSNPDRDHEADTYILQYSGHGYEHTGNWATDDNKEISLGDVLKIWDDSHAKKQGGWLVIVLDSCHSGAWVEEARRRRLKDVAIQSACAANEVTLDGAFTRLLIEYQAQKKQRGMILSVLECGYESAMHPKSYVPWQNPDVMSARSKLPFRFLSAA